MNLWLIAIVVTVYVGEHFLLEEFSCETSEVLVLDFFFKAALYQEHIFVRRMLFGKIAK